MYRKSAALCDDPGIRDYQILHLLNGYVYLRNFWKFVLL